MEKKMFNGQYCNSGCVDFPIIIELEPLLKRYSYRYSYSYRPWCEQAFNHRTLQ